MTMPTGPETSVSHVSLSAHEVCMMGPEPKVHLSSPLEKGMYLPLGKQPRAHGENFPMSSASSLIPKTLIIHLATPTVHKKPRSAESSLWPPGGPGSE